MKILELEICNVRGILHLLIEPNGRNVVIWGLNGSGKSAVVDAIDFLLTGRISRLMGEGTADISLSKHGAHIDHKPEDATVRAKIKLPAVEDTIEIKRCMGNPNDIEITCDERVKKYVEFVLWIAKRGQHVLTRGEILKYITAESGSRAKRIQDLLNISDIEDIRSVLVTVRNKADVAHRASQQSVIAAKGLVIATTAEKTYAEEQILEFVNKNRAVLDGKAISVIRSKGIQVISITENFDDSSHGMLMEAITECMDEFYSNNLGEEVTRGMRESASRGFYLSARPPYGYKKIKVQDGNRERTKLDMLPFQSRIVKTIFDEILRGKGLIDIVRDLNSRAISGPNNKGWNKTGLYHILHNEIYIGMWVWGRNSKRGLEPIRVENAFPAIIEQAVFNRVQEMLKERTPTKIHPRRTASRFLLSGLAHCSYCGKALIGRDAKSGKFSYYVCGTLEKKGAGACPSKYLNSRKFEGLVIEKIKEHILTEKHLKKLVYLVNEQIDSVSREYHEELKLLSREEDGIAVRLGKLYDAVETGKIKLDDLAPRIRELRDRQEKLLTRRCEIEIAMSDRKVELADMKLVKSYISDLTHTLDEGLLTDRRAFI